MTKAAKTVRMTRCGNSLNERQNSNHKWLADKLCRRFPGKENETQRMAIREAASFLEATEYLLTKPTHISRAVGKLVGMFIKNVEITVRTE